MLHEFNNSTEQQLLRLRETSLTSEDFWQALSVPNSPYLDYVWRHQWLPGQLAAAEVWRAAEAMHDPATSLRLWQFPHRHLAEQLPMARQLGPQRVPGLTQYAEYLLAQAGAKGQLQVLMQQVNEAETEDIDFMLTRMADLLLNRLLLQVGTQRYLIRELEFYFRQPRTHNDPYVHTSREQQQLGRWYFNDADGLDLTFGNQERNTWGGILLRGLQVVPALGEAGPPAMDYVRGPRLVLRELIANLNGVFQAAHGLELDELDTFASKPATPWRVRRYGLRHRLEGDPGKEFLARRYRFMVDGNYLRGLKDRADIVRQLGLLPAAAKEILGYFPGA